jgi:hypothetical protein
MTEKSEEPGVLLGNVGKPIKLSGMQLDGISAEAGRAGDSIKVWTRLALTSDDRFFHRVAESLSRHIEFMARQSGHAVSLKNARYVLLVVHPDNTAELWVDAAAVALRIMPKRDMVAGSVLFNNDIADVTGMSFPRVDIGEKDRIVCIFREGWRFGLFFDANPDGQLGIPEMQRDLGTLYRRLAHRDLYDAIADQATFSRLLAAGWFPFVEILGAEFQTLANSCEAGFELDDEEAQLLAKFDAERLERMFKRWVSRPHLRAKNRYCDRP